LCVGETSIGPQKEAPAELVLGLYEDSLVRIDGGADPQEMSSTVAHVLLRLPLESIAQSKLLGREWRALIESESFVAAHASIKRLRRILIATNGRARRSFFRFAPLQRWLRGSPAHLADSLAVDSKTVCSSKPSHGEKPIQRARARSARSDSDQRRPTSFPRCDADRATIIRGWVLLLF
jgi:hypothetical protein